MKKTKKPGRGREFDEGALVRSLREQDDGATGTVVSLTRKRNGWNYTVMFDGRYRLATRHESELEALV